MRSNAGGAGPVRGPGEKEGACTAETTRRRGRGGGGSGRQGRISGQCYPGLLLVRAPSSPGRTSSRERPRGAAGSGTGAGSPPPPLRGRSRARGAARSTSADRVARQPRASRRTFAAGEGAGGRRGAPKIAASAQTAAGDVASDPTVTDGEGEAGGAAVARGASEDRGTADGRRGRRERQSRPPRHKVAAQPPPRHCLGMCAGDRDGRGARRPRHDHGRARGQQRDSDGQGASRPFRAPAAARGRGARVWRRRVSVVRALLAVLRGRRRRRPRLRPRARRRAPGSSSARRSRPPRRAPWASAPPFAVRATGAPTGPRLFLCAAKSPSSPCSVGVRAAVLGWGDGRNDGTLALPPRGEVALLALLHGRRRRRPRSGRRMRADGPLALPPREPEVWSSCSTEGSSEG